MSKRFMAWSALIAALVFLLSLGWGAARQRDEQARAARRAIGELPQEAAELAASADHAHGHHHGAVRKHRDPGPRRISAREVVAEKVQAAERIGPQKELEYFGSPIKDHDGRDALLIHAQWGGGVRYGKSDSHIRKTSYALAPLETLLEHRDMLVAMHDQMDHSVHQGCAQKYVHNLWKATGKVISETIEWTLILHVKADGKTQAIDDVEAVDWPADMDAETRECYVSAFRGKEWESDETDNLYMEWRVCVQPPVVAAKEE